jgi:O-antigen ligase
VLRDKIILAFFSLAILFFVKDFLAERFSSLVEAYYKPYDLEKIYNANNVWVRIKQGESSIELINKKPLLGYGLGTSKIMLRERNLAKKYTPLTIYNRAYNSHNQFFEFWIELGLIGLFLFLWSLFPLIDSFKRNSFFIIGVYIIFIINYIPEVILDRQVGITFIVLITCFFSRFEKPKQFLK